MLLVDARIGGTQMIINRLEELRKKRNVKVADIIEAIDISQPYYYDIEKGKKRLNEDLLNKFADFYKVSTDYILGRKIDSNEEIEYKVRELANLLDITDINTLIDIKNDNYTIQNLYELLKVLKSCQKNKPE